jgi:hypothetical protein
LFLCSVLLQYDRGMIVTVYIHTYIHVPITNINILYYTYLYIYIEVTLCGLLQGFMPPIVLACQGLWQVQSDLKSRVDPDVNHEMLYYIMHTHIYIHIWIINKRYIILYIIFIIYNIQMVFPMYFSLNNVYFYFTSYILHYLCITYVYIYIFLCLHIIHNHRYIHAMLWINYITLNYMFFHMNEFTFPNRKQDLLYISYTYR